MQRFPLNIKVFFVCCVSQLVAYMSSYHYATDSSRRDFIPGALPVQLGDYAR